MGKRILLAEDNQTLAETLGGLLQRHGYQPQLVTDGIAALRALAAEPPDLLLLDLKLPGLHGIELLKKLRQSPPTAKLPVIILTGVYRGEKYQQAAAALGVRHYLEKPFKAAALLKAIGDLLGDSVPTQPERPFAHHLQTAFLRRFSGQLILHYPDTTRTLAFVNGTPVALRPGFHYRDFGDCLRSRGLISAKEYDYFVSAGGYRHDCLVQMGCLAYGDLFEAKYSYLNGELEAAFGAPPARASWQAMPAPELLQLVSLNVPQLFYRGYHQHAGSTGEKLLQGWASRFPVPTEGYYHYINFLSLDETERQFLHRLDGQHPLQTALAGDTGLAPLLLTLTSLQMLRMSEQPAAAATPGDLPIRVLFNAVEDEVLIAGDETLESFSDLVETEAEAVEAVTAVEPAAPEAPAATGNDLGQEIRLLAKSLEGKNHYEVFGIKPAKFTIDLLKERYFAITRKFGPEVLMQLGGEEAGLVEQVLSTVATAYDTLSDVIKKERYDEILGSGRIGLGREGDDKFQAQVQAESGKVFLEMEEWDNAEKALQEAVNFDSNNGDSLACLAWAIYRNPKYASSQAMQNKAKQMLNRAITMERTPQGFAYKGWILLEAGQDSLAEAEFNKALKLDARNLMARKGLRAIQEQREQQKKGLFKRMFK